MDALPCIKLSHQLENNLQVAQEKIFGQISWWIVVDQKKQLKLKDICWRLGGRYSRTILFLASMVNNKNPTDLPIKDLAIEELH